MNDFERVIVLLKLGKSTSVSIRSNRLVFFSTDAVSNSAPFRVE
jgi:hypothetical protein